MEVVYEYIWVLIGAVLSSVIAYVLILLYAKRHTESAINQPNGIKDVWWVINGALFGLVIIGLIVVLTSIS